MDGNNGIQADPFAGEIQELDARVEALHRRGGLAEGQVQPEPQAEGRADYAGRGLHSRIVKFGAVAILAFGTGVYCKGNFVKSCSAVAGYAKRTAGYAGGALFNALPREQRYEIMRDSAKGMASQKPADQAEKPGK